MGENAEEDFDAADSGEAAVAAGWGRDPRNPSS